MTDEDLRVELAAIQAELQEPPADKVFELAPFVKALTDEEFAALLHRVTEMQVSRGLQADQAAIPPAMPEEIIAIIEAIQKPGDRPTP
ncbi:hypothetical protein NDI52_28495 [Leptolyngbya sp. PL-A3]|uniref:hypothetical protein n=1 Tax=Leptolyngbya sp. PL-A3 TaxID=2933911 RepID=UPI003296B5FA